MTKLGGIIMITKKIGIIGAMELEVETLKSKMNVVKTTKKANMEFFEGHGHIPWRNNHRRLRGS